MEQKYITDTDFLPKELTHRNGSNNSELNKDLYQFVFGIFQDTSDLNHVCDLIIRAAYKEKSDLIRKFKLREWKKMLDNIMKALMKFKSKENDVFVYIPYTKRILPLSAVESYLELEKFTIGELLDSNSIPEPMFPNEPLVPSIKKLFEKSYNEIYESLDEGKPSSNGLLERTQYNHAIILDEMYRRGIYSIYYKGETRDIQPSKFYNDDSLYKRIFVDNGLKQQQESNSNVPPTPDNPMSSSVYDNDTIGIRAKVMYSMLNTFCPVNDDNFNRVVALIDFAVGKQDRRYNINTTNDPKVNLENNKNSIKKYVRDCRDTPRFLEQPNSAKVRERLIMQGFEVPEVGKGKSLE